MQIYTSVNIYTCSDQVYICIYMYVFWSFECAANIHTYTNVSFPLISSENGSKNKIFFVKTLTTLGEVILVTNATSRSRT